MTTCFLLWQLFLCQLSCPEAAKYAQDLPESIVIGPIFLFLFMYAECNTHNSIVFTFLFQNLYQTWGGGSKFNGFISNVETRNVISGSVVCFCWQMVVAVFDVSAHIIRRNIIPREFIIIYHCVTYYCRF